MKRMIYIKWVDSTFFSDSIGENEDMPLMILEDVGFLVSEDRDKVVIATQWDEENKRWRYIHSIPRVNIKEMKVIASVVGKGVILKEESNDR